MTIHDDENSLFEEILIDPDFHVISQVDTFCRVRKKRKKSRIS